MSRFKNLLIPWLDRQHAFGRSIHHHRVSYLPILIAAQLLLLGQWGRAVGTLSPDAAVQLEKLKQEALIELPVSAGYRPDYALWKENKNYIGVWRQGDNLFVSFLMSDIDYQLVGKSINDAKVIFKTEAINIDLVERGLSWGEATALQHAIFRASKLNIIPEVFRMSYGPRDATLGVGINSKDDIEAVSNALQVMGVSKDLVHFDFDRLQGN